MNNNVISNKTDKEIVLNYIISDYTEDEMYEYLDSSTEHYVLTKIVDDASRHLKIALSFEDFEWVMDGVAEEYNTPID